MRSVALAGLVAALPVRMGLTQGVPPPIPSIADRQSDPVTGGRAPVVQGPDNTHRVWLVGGLHVVVGALVYAETQRTWGHSRGRFHVKDDWTGDGLSQNDEASHLFFGYTLTKTFAGQWHWAGLPSRNARTVGAVETAGVLTMVEVLDAFNTRQGLGVQDLVFDYAGIGLGVLSLSHPAAWSIRMSMKAPSAAGLFAETAPQSDTYIFWLTYRPTLGWGARQPLSLGIGHSARRGADGVTPVRELHFGIGTTLPALVRAFSPSAARYIGILDFYYFNLNLTATLP